jgi:5-formyltetrahydrofolate cyclo-ligase
MTKSEARKIFKEKRLSLSTQEIDYLSERIFSRLADEYITNNVSHIHVYLPIKKNSEPDSWKLIPKLKNHQVIVSKSDFKDYSMQHFILDKNTQLATNDFGIPEPITGKQVDATEIDVVIIPLLAFDNQGFRVGYGKGFYDRFLQQCKPETLKIGVSFFPPIPKIDDAEPHDIRLDVCITPDRGYVFE